MIPKGCSPGGNSVLARIARGNGVLVRIVGGNGVLIFRLDVGS